MSALNRIPERHRLQAVLLRREGIGWAVGVGGLVADRINSDRTVHLSEREAEATALALADARDLILVRS